MNRRLGIPVLALPLLLWACHGAPAPRADAGRDGARDGASSGTAPVEAAADGSAASDLDADPAPPAPPALASARLGQGQDPQSYQGFVAETVEQLGAALAGNADDLRGGDRYEALAGPFTGLLGHGLLARRYFEVLRSMLAALGEDPVFAGGSGPRALAVLERRLQQIELTMAPHLDRPLTEVLGQAATFQEDWKAAVATDVQQENGLWTVEGRLPAGRAVLLPLWARFEDQRGQEHWYQYLTDQQAEAVLVFCDFAFRLRQAAVPVGEALDFLTANDTAWQNYLVQGYPQYPWEHLLNSWLVSSAWDRPPDRQFVLLHAEPGVIVELEGSSATAIDAALLVHGIGHLWYVGDDRGWFWGGSASLALPADEGTGVGYGLTLHVGRSTAQNALPHVSVGVFYHDGEPGNRGIELAVGIDVLQLLRGN